MIDLHIHMSLSDRHGVCGESEISRLLADAALSGVTEMVITPHADAYQGAASTDLDQTIALARSITPVIKVHAGCEFLIRKVADVLLAPRHAALTGDRYLQVEFLPDCRISTACECLYELKLQGYKPILVHPERISALHKSPNRAAELKQEGALLQGTLSAFVGNHGARVKNALLELLRSGHIDFLASDFHGGDYAQLISDSRVTLARLFKSEQVQRLLYDVPKIILYGSTP